MATRSAYQQALAWLSRREYSARELNNKLEQKGFESSECLSAIELLQEQKFLDDERYLGCLIRTRLSQGWGPMRIITELAEHNIHSSRAKAHEDWEKADWIKMAYQTRERRFGTELPQSYPEKAKQMQYLQRKGFDSDLIKTLFSRHAELSTELSNELSTEL